MKDSLFIKKENNFHLGYILDEDGEDGVITVVQERIETKGYI